MSIAPLALTVLLPFASLDDPDPAPLEGVELLEHVRGEEGRAYVMADALVLRDAPKGRSTTKLRINSPVLPSEASGGWVRVSVVGHDLHGWVDGRFLHRTPVSLRTLGRRVERAIARGDDEAALRFARRARALAPSGPRGIELMAAALTAAGRPREAERLHADFERGALSRVHVAYCTGDGMYLIGSLDRGGRFERTAHSVVEGEADALSTAQLSRLRRLADEVSVMPWYAGNGPILGTAFPHPKLVGSSLSLAAAEPRLAHGAMVRLGACPRTQRGESAAVMATAPIVVPDRSFPRRDVGAAALSTTAKRAIEDATGAARHRGISAEATLLEGIVQSRVDGMFERHYGPEPESVWAAWSLDGRRLARFDGALTPVAWMTVKGGDTYAVTTGTWVARHHSGADTMVYVARMRLDEDGQPREAEEVQYVGWTEEGC